MSDEREQEREGGFRVKDRRRFDESGNIRTEGANSSASEVRPSAEAVKKASAGNGVGQPAGGPVKESSIEKGSAKKDFVVRDAPAEEPALDYNSFILSLATQAMVQLGEMDPPPGVQIPKNREAAKHTIDVIEMLELKTRGNLSDSEKKLTDEILHALRLGYVRSKS